MTSPVHLLIALAICLLQDAETAKIGRCPPRPFGAGRARFCSSDNQCPGRKKCCLVKQGYACTTPAFYYPNPHMPAQNDTKPITRPSEKEKPGTCPPTNIFTGKAPFCKRDSDCEGPQKCCLTKAGNQCVQPLNEGQKAKPGTCPPYPFGPVGAAMFCQTDFDCKGTQKCCMTKVGYDCTPPAEESQEVNKPGQCPAEPPITGRALFCRGDKDCEGSEKCCVTKVGKECVKPVEKPGPNVKPGTCPPYPLIPVGAALFCQTDDDCQGTQKCCMTKVGYDCTAPMEESQDVNKPGQCPAEPPITGRALFCRSDKDCDGSEKCCVTKVGKECVKPVQKPGPNAKPGTCPPYPMGPVGAALFCQTDDDCQGLAMFCQTDFDCKGTLKCCMTKVGYDCTAPMEESQDVNKPGECPAEPAIAGKALFCRSDKDCDGSEKCCLTKVGKECVKPVQKPGPNAKPGTCPPYPMGPVGAALFCQTDDDCQGVQKCCMTKVGYECTAPMEHSQDPNKPGECPAEPAIAGKALLCRSDKDCDGSEKCCVTKVGKECVKPVEKPAPNAKPGTCPPYTLGFAGLAMFCQTDFDCKGTLKCCMTKVGYDCTAPMEESQDVSKPGQCPAEPPITGRALFCRSDNDCDGSEKCCVTKVGKECVKPVQRPGSVVKPGSCPAVPFGPVGLANFCHSDGDCEGSLKCCITSVGYECTSPVEESQDVNKPGECPAEPAIAGKALFCRSDKDCDGSEKCCLTKVGKECVKPVQEPGPNAKPGTCPPYTLGFAGLAMFCQTDFDCKGTLKCCMTKVGYDCTAPMEESQDVNKPGECPAEPAIAGKALFCRSDKDCDGSEKCCLTKVGKECVKPVQEPGPNAKPGTCPPYPMGPVGAALFCQTDDDCQGVQKCCMTKVGYECTAPMEHSQDPNKPGECPAEPANCTAPMEESQDVNKPGQCPAEPPITGRALFCRSDKDCDGSEKCCVTKVGKECVKPVQKPGPNVKPGTCPPYPMGPVGAALFCQTDDDCQGIQKCCMTKVGYECTAPMEHSQDPNKPGECPAEPAIAGKALLCRSDKDCDGSEKCCVTKVGKECVKPVEKPGPNAKPGTCPPYTFGFAGLAMFEKPGPNVKPGTCPPYPMGPVGAALFCQTDDDCQGTQKCCMTKVGYDCTAPMEESQDVNKPGECPAEPPVTGRALFCRSDKDCDGSEKCCVTKVGKECVKPIQRPGSVVKPGSCPAVPFGPVGLANFCHSDGDCEGSLKCCITSVGYECTSPVEESLRPSKRGICPWPSSVMERGRLCSSDGDCQGSRKCCPTKAGNACVKPVSEGMVFVIVRLDVITVAAFPEVAGGRGTCPPAAYVMGLPGSCRRDKDCEDGKKCCVGIEGKSCSVLVLPS
ncbi:hypothetical protein M513_05101 [Trichuris suis]|uniref:WAP domain-containing protein n=1 Tax=Trichuris suis TaxID=68888 RepID=A0A085MA36_9BILA|nr:hypothetical protein M513_05101 [Trichuris suis]